MVFVGDMIKLKEIIGTVAKYFFFMYCNMPFYEMYFSNAKFLAFITVLLYGSMYRIDDNMILSA